MNLSNIFRRDKLKEGFKKSGLVETVELSAADIIGMNAAGVVVIPSKGANTVIEVTGVVMSLNAGSTAFTGGGAIAFEDNENFEAVCSTIPAGAITSASDVVNIAVPVSASYEGAKGAGITITNGTAPFATGDGTVSLKISYRLHEM